jgi:hypothetical protein
VGDVLFIAILVAFFALAALFVRACDRMIGDEAESTDRSPVPAELDEAA